MTVNQGNTHAERLRQANHGVVYSGVAMGVILTNDVTDGTGRLHMRTGRRVARFVHCVKNTAMNRLQTVAHIGERSCNDNRHRIFQKRCLHRFAKFGAQNLGTFAESLRLSFFLGLSFDVLVELRLILLVVLIIFSH